MIFKSSQSGHVTLIVILAIIAGSFYIVSQNVRRNSDFHAIDKIVKANTNVQYVRDFITSQSDCTESRRAQEGQCSNSGVKIIDPLAPGYPIIPKTGTEINGIKLRARCDCLRNDCHKLIIQAQRPRDDSYKDLLVSKDLDIPSSDGLCFFSRGGH